MLFILTVVDDREYREYSLVRLVLSLALRFASEFEDSSSNSTLSMRGNSPYANYSLTSCPVRLAATFTALVCPADFFENLLFPLGNPST